MYIGALKFSHSYFNVYVARVAPLGFFHTCLRSAPALLDISDGLVIYVSNYITETTEVLTINNVKIINSKIAIEKNMISALYRSHDISKTEFLLILKT